MQQWEVRLPIHASLRCCEMQLAGWLGKIAMQQMPQEWDTCCTAMAQGATGQGLFLSLGHAPFTQRCRTAGCVRSAASPAEASAAKRPQSTGYPAAPMSAMPEATVPACTCQVRYVIFHFILLDGSCHKDMVGSPRLMQILPEGTVDPCTGR